MKLLSSLAVILLVLTRSGIAQTTTSSDLVGTWRGTGPYRYKDHKEPKGVAHTIDIKADGKFFWTEAKDSLIEGKDSLLLIEGAGGDWKTMGDTLVFNGRDPVLYKLQSDKQAIHLRHPSDTLWNVTLTRVKP